MSFRKFKFISPGVFINEIDNSQLPALPEDVGPVVIGRTEKGPGLTPIKVNSFSEFVQIFGNPMPGAGGGDVFRDGNKTAPTYAAYAAQAWLRNNSPLTFVRLTGRSHVDATNLTDDVSGYAGWRTTKATATTGRTSNGGAFGLFLVEGTGSIGVTQDVVDNITTSGTLAAVWYINSGSVELSGTDMGGNTEQTGSGKFIKSVDTNNTFKVIIKSTDSVETVNSAFDFTPTSPRFIRKVFNTNPTLTNRDITTTDNAVNYWLGETFEGALTTFKDNGNGVEGGISGSVASQTFGIILPLASPDGSTKNGGDVRVTSTKDLNAKTGWFISQDMSSDFENYTADAMTKLFRIAARDFSGEEVQRKVKISIQDIKRSADSSNKYGSFTVAVRDIKDTDNAPIVLEQYNNCNLNPASENYVAKKIGNSFRTWSDTDRRYKYFGEYPNVSDYVRIEMDEDVDRASTNPELLPFGVWGPPRYLPFATSGSVFVKVINKTARTTEIDGTTGAFVCSSSYAGKEGTEAVTGSADGDDEGQTVNAIFAFPSLRLRISSSEGTVQDPTDAYFGVDTTYNSTKFNESVRDVLRTKANDISGFDADSNYTETSFYFSLDDVRNVALTSSGMISSSATYDTHAVYQSGSRALGISYTVHSASSDAGGYETGSYTNILDAGFDRFTTCLAGGFDGLNIKERDPFNDTRSLASGKNETTSYAFNSVKVAIDAVRDPERVEMNLAAMPGIVNNSLNDALVKVCEARGDSMAIIDIKNVYTPDTENTQSAQDRIGTVATAVNNLRNNLQLNSSYGATYYPWVQIRDTINGATLWAPPSVAILGTLSFSEAASALWFAPAGFTRGGLSANNAAGIPVVGLTQKLTSKERDTLYDANINPIASFPAEGIVVFGQKTLQVTPSALDRINVRRLMIYLKKQISRMAATLLFDQNVESTWNRFRGQVEPFLSDVKAGLGITDYRLILDRTTTTPDLIDRNIMYAKIFIKPARAIEFIAIDFVITDSGASFED
tara:strand:+ start:2647 stop:5676 length:3030 start_codon:yes stop_codon:yes gene_type:complete